MLSRYAIGGFNIACDSGNVALDDPDPVYLPFWLQNPARTTDGDEIRVTLSRGVEPLARGDRLLFEAAGAWRLFGRDRERRFIHAPGDGQAQWAAAMQLDRPRDWRVDWSPELLGGDVRQGLRLRNPVTYPLDFLLMVYALADEGFIIHGCGVKVNGRCGILTGVSGSGKSTMARLWRGAPEVEVLSDDRIIVRRIGRRFYAFGTPWLGDAGVACNVGGPLAWIGHLVQAHANQIRRLLPGDALPRLFRTVSVPWFDRAVLSTGLQCIDHLTGAIPQLEVAFTPSSTIVGLLRSQTQSL